VLFRSPLADFVDERLYARSTDDLILARSFDNRV